MWLAALFWRLWFVFLIVCSVLGTGAIVYKPWRGTGMVVFAAIAMGGCLALSFIQLMESDD